ncbi:hypothetical protein BLL41_14575 [Bacillus sp. FMQ74]|uniref:hypothetical protein n=1 Tax=Bacillus sp. FMQ74 TaxID=1913579 RepID=UPI0008FBBC94|nr:hypothetical protein [Bacillus sp. FMQ74]OIR60630.1 hypothetical protein BLL41_14575 [Bacillus sp. FMQ74]
MNHIWDLVQKAFKEQGEINGHFVDVMAMEKILAIKNRPLKRPVFLMTGWSVYFQLWLNGHSLQLEIVSLL